MQDAIAEVTWVHKNPADVRQMVEDQTLALMQGESVTAFGVTITAADVVTCARSFEGDHLSECLCRMALGCELSADKARGLILTYGRSLVFGLYKLNERWENYDELLIASAADSAPVALDPFSVALSVEWDEKGAPYYIATGTTNRGNRLIAEGYGPVSAYHELLALVYHRAPITDQQ